MPNPDFDQISATSLKNYHPVLINNLKTLNAIMYSIKESGMWKEEDGGATIVVPRLYGDNTNTQAYSGDDILLIAPQTGIDAAEVNWKQLHSSARINGFQQFVNQGKQKVIDLVGAKILQMETSMRNEESVEFFGDGTGTLGKELDGLDAAVEDGTVWGVYAGIDSNLDSTWRNFWNGTGGVFGTASNGVGMSAIRAAYFSVTDGTEYPDLGITTQVIFQLIVNAHTTQERFVDHKMLEAGFENIKIMRMNVTYDSNMITDCFMGLNTKKIKYVVGKGRNFIMTEWQRLFEYDARIASMFVYRNLVTYERRKHFRIDNLTAS